MRATGAIGENGIIGACVMSRPSGRRNAIFKGETGIFIIFAWKSGRFTLLRKARFSVVDVDRREYGRSALVSFGYLRRKTASEAARWERLRLRSGFDSPSDAPRRLLVKRGDGSVVNVETVKTGVERRRF